MIFNKKQTKNLGYLYVVQVVNQIFPVITIPILIAGLGLNEYGVLQFALSFSGYVYLIADYGFALSAPRDIARNRDNVNYISRLYYIVQTTRLLMLVSCYVLVGLFFVLTDVFSLYETVCLYMILYTCGNILFPVWYFQGMEDLRYSASLTLVTKASQFICIYYSLRNNSDIMVIVAIYCCLNCLQAIIAHIVILKKYKLIFYRPKISDIKDAIRSGWVLFVSQSATSLFSSANILILGAVATPAAVAIFATGEKIVRAAVNFIGPISRVIYPSSCRLFPKSYKVGLEYIKSIAKYVVPLFAMGSIMLFALSEFIAIIFTKEYYTEVALIIKILAPLPLFIMVNNLAGTQIILNVNAEKTLKNIVVSTGILNIIIAFILAQELGAVGMATSSLVAELYMMLATLVFAKIKGDKYEKTQNISCNVHL
ncbi:oligosaccharide flippase family protein [Bacillus salipaludis]|uniref:Oligosaccharide flippase family protein n=1 Tax=Bacillus salipaludis TaxID=2547811 RepID=A0ABW8RPX3_9BACI